MSNNPNPTGDKPVAKEERQSHHELARIAARIIHREIRRDINVPPSVALRMAAAQALDDHPLLTRMAFEEAAKMEVAYLSASTIRTCWYRGRRDYLEGPTDDQ